MECRLENFTTDFTSIILPFCVHLFRRLYKDSFEDNHYREDYVSKSPIMEFDGEQLLQNIILLSKPLEMIHLFQHIVIDKCTFTSTASDKFNFYGDDKMQCKKFAAMEDSYEDTVNVIRLLFDGITDGEIFSLMQTH